jgi:hypothetical protein
VPSIHSSTSRPATSSVITSSGTVEKSAPLSLPPSDPEIERIKNELKDCQMAKTLLHLSDKIDYKDLDKIKGLLVAYQAKLDDASLGLNVEDKKFLKEISKAVCENVHKKGYFKSDDICREFINAIESQQKALSGFSTFDTKKAISATKTGLFSKSLVEKNHSNIAIDKTKMAGILVELFDKARNTPGIIDLTSSPVSPVNK